MSDCLPETVCQEARFLLRGMRPARLRTMRQFAEQEIVLPTGEYAGRRFSCARQPYSAALLDAIDSGRWRRFVITGPTQSGKTLCGFLIPLLYHLFEYRETVICGLPSMDMVADKWNLNILPVIAASRYREFLPRVGHGSRGGLRPLVQFSNGAVLRFMTGGGSDKARAGFSARVVVITETDGMDEPGARSREADKITQLEARTFAYGDRARIYMECTLSTVEGRTWQEYTKGTASELWIRCPHCQQYVLPGRDDLIGWREAADEIAAAGSTWICPACRRAWTEADRLEANRHHLLVHRGQKIEPSGQVVGELPATTTLGFRWSAVHNLFRSAGQVGAAEWRAAHAAAPEIAEREMRQFWWALPSEPKRADLGLVEWQPIARRGTECPRGWVPPGDQTLGIGVDIGYRLLHWCLVAVDSDTTVSVVDYGVIEIKSDDLGFHPALMVALRDLRDLCQAGWPQQGRETRLFPAHVWIDSGWGDSSATIYEFVREHGLPFCAAKGVGTSQTGHRYLAPKTTGNVIVFVATGYHAVYLSPERIALYEVDADYWKSQIHDRLRLPIQQPGALRLFRGDQRQHTTFAKHLTAERRIEEFQAGRGNVVRWETISRNNHYFDALYLALAAATSGAQLEGFEPAASNVVRLRMPDGRPYLVTQRET